MESRKIPSKRAQQSDIADPIEMGVFEPRDGAFILGAELTGGNPASKAGKSFLGLDCIQILKP